MKAFNYLIISLLIVLMSCSENLEERIVYSHPNKTPAIIEYYKKGDTATSPVKVVRYYFNGEKQEETNYKEGKKDGESTMWFMSGEKMFIATYKDDQFDGPFIQWYENGEKEYEAFYTNGRPSGTWKYYKNDGSLQKEQKF